MTRIVKNVLDCLLEHEWVYRLLIMIPTLPDDSFWFRVRERCQKLRLKSKGFGGYLQDTHIRYPHNVSIGDRVTFGGRVLINGLGEIRIGSDCLIAYGVTITTATHDSSAKIMNRSTISDPVKIGNNVWLGVGAIVLPGVSLADGTIVGAGAVVTKSYSQPDLILLGVPAKPSKTRTVVKQEQNVDS